MWWMRRLNGGVIAGWPVDPAIWMRFVADDRAAERERRKLNNAIRLKDWPRHAVDMIVGDDCLQVGRDFHRVALHEPKEPG
jgi:hypothetical protein